MFNADTMNISPFDFARLVFKFKSDLDNDALFVTLKMVIPDLNFKLTPLPSLKLVSTPLSRLLLGKKSSNDEA